MGGNMTEPCRRTTGSFRKYFDSKEEAERFAKDPENTAYHRDIAHLCLKCGRWHLSQAEWLVPDHLRVMRSVN